MDDPAFFDSALRGLTKQPPQSIDPLYSSEVQSRLYRYVLKLFEVLIEKVKASFDRGNQPTGGDLIAITIQRGREHGIPGYNQFREWCGLRKVTTFDELSNEMFVEVSYHRPLTLLSSHYTGRIQYIIWPYIGD